MWKKVGIVRKTNELKEALAYFYNLKKQINKKNIFRRLKANELIKVKGDAVVINKMLELINLVELAAVITKAALNRPKSLGAHYID